MGLSVGRSIIEAHGGRLWASNNPEGGARFDFTVPAAAGNAHPAEASHQLPAQVAHRFQGPVKIAIIDDDASQRNALARLLESAGHATRAFASAAEFLASSEGFFVRRIGFAHARRRWSRASGCVAEPVTTPPDGFCYRRRACSRYGQGNERRCRGLFGKASYQSCAHGGDRELAVMAERLGVRPSAISPTPKAASKLLDVLYATRPLRLADDHPLTSRAPKETSGVRSTPGTWHHAIVNAVSAVGRLKPGIAAQVVGRAADVG